MTESELLLRAIERLDLKLDDHKDTILDKLEAHKEHTDAAIETTRAHLDVRVTRLEHLRIKVAGGLAVISALGAGAWAVWFH